MSPKLPSSTSRSAVLLTCALVSLGISSPVAAATPLRQATPVLGPHLSRAAAAPVAAGWLRHRAARATPFVGPHAVSASRLRSVAVPVRAKAVAPILPVATAPARQTATTVALPPSSPSPSAAGSTPVEPSPEATTEANTAGWQQVMYEDFTGTTLPSNFGSYSGQPGGNPGGWWDKSHVSVHDGSLVLAGYQDGGKWTTGGAMAWGPAQQTYGKYEVRFRMTKAKGVKYALLLWPKSDRWPVDGEIDFAEDGGDDRRTTSATLHYGTDNRQIQHETTSDFSSWQVAGVEWTPGKIVYTLNGKPWATVTGSMVPSGAMNLAVQSEAMACTPGWTQCPDASTPSRVDLEVDWIKVSKQV